MARRRELSCLQAAVIVAVFFTLVNLLLAIVSKK